MQARLRVRKHRARIIAKDARRQATLYLIEYDNLKPEYREWRSQPQLEDFKELQNNFEARQRL